MPNERQLLADVLRRLERRLANGQGQDEVAPHDRGETARTDTPIDHVQILRACAKVKEAIAILDATDGVAQPAQHSTEVADGAVSETFRTKLKVKDGGMLIAERIPSLLSIETGDDLTRIRGIDDSIARRLTAIGVSRFAQIAAWRMDDVRGVASALGLGRTINRQNWIEQAQLLQSTKPAEPTATSAPVKNNLPARQTAREMTDLTIEAQLSTAIRPTVDLNDILAIIRAGSATRQTAENIAIAQQHSTAGEIIKPQPSSSAEIKPVIERRAELHSTAASKPSIEPAPVPPMALTHPMIKPAPEVQAEASPAIVPIHEQATKRLDLLEAEIRTLGDVPENTRAAPEPESVRRPLTTLWHPPHSDQYRSRPDPIPPVAGEAEVEIVQRKPTATDLQPSKPVLRRPLAIRELTVRPSRPTHHPKTVPRPLASTPDEDSIEEASVVIVKRPAATTLTTEQSDAPANPNPVAVKSRRFVRSLTGE